MTTGIALLVANKPSVVAAPPFVPTDIAGLNVWLDASQLTQADGATMLPGSWPNLGLGPQPTLVDSLPLATCKTNALNGLRAVRHGTNGSRWRFTGIGIGYSYTFVGVARVWNVATKGRIISALLPSGGNLLLGWWDGNMDTCYAGGFFGPQKTQTTAWKLYSVDCDNVVRLPRLFINGVYADAMTVAATEGWGSTFNINGVTSTLDETCDCDVAEVLLYNRQLSDAERAQVEGYLRTKWTPPGTAWKPTDLGANLLGWFDGADAATVTITGSGVSAWTNKGVSTLTLSQGVDARRPSYASNTVTFSHTGAGQHLIGGILAPNPVAAYDFLIAGKPLQGGVDWRTLIYSTGQHVTIEDTSERYGVYNGGMFATGIWGNVAGLSYGQISNAGPAKFSRDGGALISSNTTLSTDTSTWGFGSAGSYGGGGVVDQAWGDVYEFILVPYNSSDDTRQKLEGYAAWKWGLQGLLPSGHPYKAAAP